MRGSSPSSSDNVDDDAAGREHIRSRGRLEAADGGTVVLQDVGYLSWRLQGRLRRFIDTGIVQRVGSSLATPSDVRMMAITHRSLVHAVGNQAFRDDLFSRIDVIHIEVPPLRDRCDDVPALFRYFLCVQCSATGPAGRRADVRRAERV